MSEYIQVDASKVNDLLKRLSVTDKEAKKAFRTALRKSAGVIQKQVRENMKGVRNQATGKTLKYKNLLQFVNLTIYKDLQGARVDIMDNKKKSTNERLAKKGLSNKSFTLKFFSMGTQDRYTRGHRKYYTNAFSYKIRVKRKGKGGYRGRIGKSDFFKNAVSGKQQEAETLLGKMIVEHINKVVSKRI